MITPSDREWIAGLCAARAGLRVDPEKAYLIENRLAPVARRDGFGSLGEFVQALRGRGEDRLLWAAVEAMATAQPGFFHEPAALAALTAEVLPRLVAARPGAPIRIWNAACGAGQEAYSLAMALNGEPDLAGRAELFASDLSERNLEKAQAGLYSQLEVQRGLPARLLVRHFEKHGDAFALSPRLRQAVRWRRVNLAEEAGRLGSFEVVVCRGLLPTLTEAGRSRVLGALTGALAPGGVLVMGLADAPPAWLEPIGPGLFAAPEPIRSAA